MSEDKNTYIQEDYDEACESESYQMPAEAGRRAAAANDNQRS